MQKLQQEVLLFCQVFVVDNSTSNAIQIKIILFKNKKRQQEPRVLPATAQGLHVWITPSSELNFNKL
jgi:hypothetical protein